MKNLWLKNKAWIKDCGNGLIYASLIVLVALYAGADSTGFRYFEL